MALPKPDIPEITEWLTPLMEHFDVLEKDYSFLPINKGLLVYFRNYGLLWLPDEYLDKLSSSDNLKKTVVSGVTSGIKIASTIATRGLSLVGLNVVDKLFKTIAKPPPTIPFAYLQNTIFEVQYIPIDAYKDLLADYSTKHSTAVSKDLDLEMEQEVTTEKGALMIVDKMSVILEDKMRKNKETNANKERKKFWKKSASTIQFFEVFKITSNDQTVLYRFSNKDHAITFLEALTQSKIRITSRKPYH
ncbi:MAG: hypothetical protein KAR35_00485 [Candidatus Heimdallarchaeota archaeon]|nr:hypothetical protein [Candidatus Heimdallarchaeota archaeon]MCK5047828.1 hypothetical protein [Candidatus Heimdallarchaeota archaeon]